MTKKDTVIGTLLFAAAFAVLIYSQRYSRQNPRPAEVRQAFSRQTATAAQAAATPAEEPMFTTARADRGDATATSLSNAFIQVRFTNFGGAIRDVAFLKYPAALERTDPFIFNELHADPILAIEGVPGLDRETRYELVSKSDHEAVYRAVLDGKLEVLRRYVLSPNSGAGTDPYLVRCEVTLRNLSDATLSPLRLPLSLGTAAPSSPLDNGLQLTTEAWDGKDQTLTRRSSLEGGNGFFGIGASSPKAFVTTAGPVVWATVKNQFFASILTPDQPASSLETRRTKLFGALPDTDRNAYGITGAVDFDVPALGPHAQTTIGATLYVGPKEYPRLSNADVFKNDQDRIMDFGNFVFRFCAAILLTLMTWIHGWATNWGVAIILTTLALKFVFVPLSVNQARISRRMQKIQPEMTALREKYKDNPQKLQAATMELFKLHKVNPAAGCVPMLLTIPFFFAFFRMLQSAAELRFAHFLWARDLSAPDIIASVTVPLIGSHLNIEILPIVLCAVSFFQNRVMPQPSVDNAQARMMKFLPLVFLVFYYNWACALSLYSTVNGLFTIGQQLVINRTRDVADTPGGRGGKPVKNVTPKKR